MVAIQNLDVGHPDPKKKRFAKSKTLGDKPKEGRVGTVVSDSGVGGIVKDEDVSSGVNIKSSQ